MIRCVSWVKGRLIDEERLSKSYTCRWVHIASSSSAELIRFERELRLPLKALVTPRLLRQLPFVAKNRSVLVIKIPYAAGKDQYRLHPFYVFLGKKELVTFVPEDPEWGKKIGSMDSEELREVLPKGPTFVLFSLLELILEAYFDVISQLDESSNRLEEDVLKSQSPHLVQEIFRLKKSITLLHRSLNSNRNVVLSLENGLVPHASPRYSKHFRNQYNDFMELIDLISAYRDSLSATLDMYISMVSNNLNIVMKRMTALGSLVLVPTLIAGIYGMNFQFQPEFHWKYGYLWALGVMICSVLVLTWYFKKKGYF